MPKRMRADCRECAVVLKGDVQGIILTGGMSYSDYLTATVVNLYDIVLKFLDEQGMWEPLCDAEESVSRNEIIMMLQDTVSVADVICPAVEEQIAESGCDIAFITGVGETFPYVRTHSLLSDLELEVPVVLVFPGQYRQSPDGSTSLDILGIPSSANGGYYRATNVFDL